MYKSLYELGTEYVYIRNLFMFEAGYDPDLLFERMCELSSAIVSKQARIFEMIDRVKQIVFDLGDEDKLSKIRCKRAKKLGKLIERLEKIISDHEEIIDRNICDDEQQDAA